MEGLVKEGQEQLQKDEEDVLNDMAIAGAAKKVLSASKPVLKQANSMDEEETEAA